MGWGRVSKRLWISYPMCWTQYLKALRIVLVLTSPHPFLTLWERPWWTTCRMWKHWLCQAAGNRTEGKSALTELILAPANEKCSLKWPECSLECSPGVPVFSCQRLIAGRPWLTLAGRHSRFSCWKPGTVFFSGPPHFPVFGQRPFSHLIDGCSSTGPGVI